MSLAIYDEDRIKIADFANVITSSHNGTLGEAVDILLYLRNDDPNLYYQAINVSFQDNSGADDLLGPSGTGWGVKVSATARRPTVREWDAISYDNTGSLANIGSTSQADTSTYSPFWIRVVAPGNTPAQVKADISLLVSATEHLVGA